MASNTICLIYLLVLVAPSTLDPVTVETPNELFSEGDVKLDGGEVGGTGNVLIYHEGSWGSICDDGWNLEASHVVCSSLGFPYALGHTTRAYFGKPDEGILLDDIRCYGDEASLLDCQNAGWGIHDCDRREAAGVFCAPAVVRQVTRAPTQPPTTMARMRTVMRPTTTTTTTTTTTPAPMTEHHLHHAPAEVPQHLSAEVVINELPPLRDDSTITGTNLAGNPNAMKKIKQLTGGRDDNLVEPVNHQPEAYEIRLMEGRNPNEGRVEVFRGGRWAAICSDGWTILEAAVVCKQTDKGFAQMAVPTSSFGGDELDKVFGGLRCDGTEDQLSDCYHSEVRDVMCPQANMVAGVVCSSVLPDLMPNATLLQISTYLEDVPMMYLQCAMEENCAASTAYDLVDSHRDWQQLRRRLLRFSSSTWNFGTADFRPFIPKNQWEWHACHMHYHSMSVFATYDLLDLHGNRVAEGHKASFCLEDVECLPGVEKKYVCKGFGDQGISVGCADNYLHDIDCQWIDITDVSPGNYVFRVHINPEFYVTELSYINNAAECQLNYTGYQVYVTNCTLGAVPGRPTPVFSYN